VSPAPGRPPAYQADTDADALVRLDQLAQVRLALPGAGGSGATGGGSGAGDPGGATAGWFVAGGRRLAPVRLAPLPATGAAPGATPAPTAPSTGGPEATLTVGAPVRVWPVPPGAPAPAIDPLLRRAPP
jgi:hypothetical protein